MLKLRVKLVGGSLPAWKDTADAGLDLKSSEDMIIGVGERKCVPLGICTSFNSMYVGLLRDRSGLALRGMILTGGVIDSGYRGEWKATIKNDSRETWQIQKGERICQVLFIPVIHLEVIQVDSLEESLRGDKGYGSSGL